MRGSETKRQHSSSPALDTRARTDGEKSSRQKRKKFFRCVKENSVLFPCVKIASPNHDAYMEKDVTFNMLRQRRIPTTSRRKRWCKRISCAFFLKKKKKTLMWMRVSRSSSRKFILRKEGELRSNHALIFKGTLHQKAIREGQGPSRGIIHKCQPHERKFEERSQDEISRAMRPQSSMGLGMKFFQAQECGQDYVLLSS